MALVAQPSWPALVCVAAACMALSILPDCCWSGPAEGRPQTGKAAPAGGAAADVGAEAVAIARSSVSPNADVGVASSSTAEKRGAEQLLSAALASCSAADVTPGSLYEPSLNADSDGGSNDKHCHRVAWGESLDERAYASGDLDTCCAPLAPPVVATMSAGSVQGEHDPHSVSHNNGTVQRSFRLLAVRVAPFNTSAFAHDVEPCHALDGAPAAAVPLQLACGSVPVALA